VTIEWVHRARAGTRFIASMMAGACASLVSPSCSQDDTPTVVVYVSVDEQTARPVFAAFEKSTGIRVLPKFDTEATKTAGLVNLLRSEKDHPRADVFWSSEIFMTVQLAEEGVLAPLGDVIPKDWPGEFRGNDDRWAGFAARARVIVYSTDRVPAGRVPKRWADLTRDWWKGRLVMADPRFGTTRGHLGAMKSWWDKNTMSGFYEAFFEGLAENGVRLLENGNSGVVQAIVSGEADVGMTDTDDVHAAKAQGAKIEMVYAWHDSEAKPGGGTLVIPNTVGLVAGGEHGAESKRLIEFLLSEQVERMLAQSPSRNIPLRPALAAEFPVLSVPSPLAIDFSKASSEMDGAVTIAMKIIEEVKARTPNPGRPDEETPAPDSDPLP
jgi:iron(III) transport system substrate-binding protein